MLDTRRYLDFEVIKESWNKYSPGNGTKLKTRVMLELVWHTEEDKKQHAFGITNSIIVMCDPSLQGSKNQTKYTP